MNKIPFFLTFILLMLSATSYAQWAVSSNGDCLYDVFGNVISGSCQTNAKCKYKESGTTRRTCLGVPTPFGCWGFEYTEKLFLTECPLDDTANLFCLGCGVLGFFFLNRNNNKNHKFFQREY
ncbi:hypothetical protein [Pedobacter miscanthi]|nr:hypothetical protein [Pedobacter miscanthi]